MKMSYAHRTSNVPLIGQTIGDLLDEVAARFPTNEALVSVFENRRFTYAQFTEEVNRVARALMGLGVGKDDRVGVWSLSRPLRLILQPVHRRLTRVAVYPAAPLHSHSAMRLLVDNRLQELRQGRNEVQLFDPLPLE